MIQEYNRAMMMSPMLVDVTRNDSHSAKGNLDKKRLLQISDDFIVPILM